MQHMAQITPTLCVKYNPPAPKELSASIKKLIELYPNDNPARIRLIHILQALDNFKDSVIHTDATYTQEEWRDIELGAYLFCLLSIGEYANSTLYQILLEQAEINELKNPGEQGTLIYLEKFYRFLNHNPALVNTEEKWLDDYLAEKKIGLDEVKKEVNYVLRSYTKQLHQHILALGQVIPTEKDLQQSIEALPDNYLEAKKRQEAERAQTFFKLPFESVLPNKDREFIGQLGKIGIQLLPKIYGEVDNSNPNSLSLPRRIMIGYLWFILQSIYSACLIKSLNNSQMYKLGCPGLHILGVDDPYNFMDKNMQEICLTAFESFIKRDDIAYLIEIESNKQFGEENQLQYIHPRLRKMTKKLEAMNDQLQDENTLSLASRFPNTMRLSVLMSLIADSMFPITVGLGAFGGLMASNALISMNAVKFVTTTINALGAILPGGPGTILMYVGAPFAAHRMVEAGAIATCSTAVHYLLKGAMFLTGGAVGALIIDIPAHEVGKCYELLKQRMGERLEILEAEYQFVQSAQQLPREAYYYASDWDRIQLVSLDSLKNSIEAAKELSNEAVMTPRLELRELAFYDDDKNTVSSIKNRHEEENEDDFDIDADVEPIRLSR
jgi:hypothetical protein